MTQSVIVRWGPPLKKLQINGEMTGKLEAKSSKRNKPSFKQAGKQSFGSYPNLPANSQSACQASLLSDWGWQQELAKQRDGEKRTRDREAEKEREGVFITQKDFSSSSRPLPLALSHRGEIRRVKVTDIDNCISGKRDNYSEFYYFYWQPHICRRRYKAKRQPSPLCFVGLCVGGWLVGRLLSI